MELLLLNLLEVFSIEHATLLSVHLLFLSHLDYHFLVLLLPLLFGLLHELTALARLRYELLGSLQTGFHS